MDCNSTAWPTAGVSLSVPGLSHKQIHTDYIHIPDMLSRSKT